MLKRLLIGLAAGGLVGVLVAAALVFGLHVVVLGGVLAYLAAAAAGVLTGLVAGKPIWAQGAKIEAGLKALFGAALAAGGMYAARAWLHLDVNLEALQPGMHGAFGDVPFAALPLVAAVLGALYEVDNTDAPSSDARARPSQQVRAGKSRVAPLPDADGVDGVEEEGTRGGPARASKPVKRR